MSSLLRRIVTWCIGGLLAKSSADGHGDELAGRSEPDEPSYQIPVRRLWPFGLRSRPPAGVEVVVVFPNGSPVAGVMVGAESAKYGPSDLEEGESALYNATAAVIRIWKNGKVTVDSDGADVVVNGGTLPVARKTDPTKDGKVSMTAAPSGPNTLITFLYTPEGGAPQTIGTITLTPAGGTAVGSVAPVQISGKIDDGAAQFKA